ncbi:hypothetical protein J4Q44_G00147790 [Coregonus suidteri]|uniref:Calponin-homology (CH) domain-containing protein n=1 Tax=Coregonus suidteri TaxID=861788 RepID=A0AAN8LZ45_9TELE
MCVFLLVQGRTADYDEPLRIEEDTHWASEQTSKVTEGTHIAMINQLKEAVELLQDPNRVSMETEDLSGVQLYPVEMVMVEDSLNGQDSDGSEGQTTPKGEDRVPGSGPTFTTPLTPPFGLKHRSVFLRTHKSLESVDPQFTMRRKMEQLREELELMEQLRESIESRLKVALPEDLGSSLMDGVVLCHLANHIRPRSVASIHVPSSAVPKLSMAKCRRNVENFLDACRKMGVPESSLCSAYDIIQCHLRPICVTVCALVAMETPTEGRNSDRQGKGPSPNPSPAPEASTQVAQAPPPAWQPWDLIGSSLVHVFCLLLLFVAYSWSELT